MKAPVTGSRTTAGEPAAAKASVHPSSNGDGCEDKGHGALARWRPWDERSSELAVHFEKHWVVRTDCFGQYYQDAEGRFGQVTTKDVRLTQDVLQMHCRARQAEQVVGAHTTIWMPVDGAPGGGVSLCRQAQADIDHHGDGEPPEANLQAALAWREALVGLGFRPLLLDSNGKGGYRLVVIFDELITARHARQLMRWVKRDWPELGLAQCPEIFPKQDEITAPGSPSRSFGNWLRLPGRHYRRDHWSRVWDGSEFVEGDAAIDAILDYTGDSPRLIPDECLKFEPEPRTAGDARPTARTDEELEGDAKLAQEALGWLGPGVKDKAGREYGSDYDHWLRVGMACHDLGDGYLWLWVEWSRQWPDKFDEDVCIYKWGTFRREEEKRVRLGTLIAYAKHAGWRGPAATAVMAGETGPSAATADDAPPPPDDPDDDDDIHPDDEYASFAYTDVGNGRLMAQLFGDRIRYCFPWKTWLIWDRRRWRRDDGGAIFRIAKRVIREMVKAAEKCDDDKEYRARLGWAAKTCEKKAFNAMIELARSEPGISITPAELDADEWLLNVKNGTLDLRSGTLRPHRREDLITMLAPVVYDPTAKAPRCEQFEEEIFLANKDLIAYVRRTIAIALTGSDQVQELNIWHGEGSNGKNVYLDTIHAILGDYATVAEPDLLLHAKSERHPTGVADLFGKRFVTASETDDGKTLAEALMKRLTGDRTIKARRMCENFFQFDRTFKVFLATNHKPEVRGQDYATWRRIRLVPFAATFVKNGEPINPPAVRHEDPTLGAALLKEKSGILNLLVDACLDWQKNGLRPPEAVIAATDDYRKSMDHIPEFIQEACELDPKAKVPTDVLYAVYDKWCRSSNYKPMAKKAFGRNIGKKGYPLEDSNSRSFRKGLKIRNTT